MYVEKDGEERFAMKVQSVFNNDYNTLCKIYF